MIESFLKNKKLIVFALSMLVGGSIYLVFAYLLIVQSTKPSPSPKADSTEIRPTRFEGRFQLFATSEKAVDLAYDASGSIYFLNQDGSIVVKIDQESDTPNHLHSFFQVTSDTFLKAKGCNSIAFHPDYLDQSSRGFGKFYVSLSEKKGAGRPLERVAKEKYQEVVYEFASENPAALPLTALKREVLRISRPTSTENTSITDLTFDKNGLLYIGVADLSDEKKSKASDLESIYGKVLRIDPLADTVKGTPYRVPSKNPFFQVENCRPELWAFGLRNPHTISYDRFQEWICISDTGRGKLEEINVSKFGAEFFGWNLSEEWFLDLPSASEPGSSDILSSPQIEYARGDLVGRNVGGLIYRGERFPYLDGNAIFADERGRLITGVVKAKEHTEELSVLEPAEALTDEIQCLKEGPRGELFALCKNGKIFELSKARSVQRRFRPGRTLMACIWK